MEHETANMNGKHLFRIECVESGDVHELLGRPCELSAFSFVPKSRAHEPAARSVFNTKRSSREPHEDEASERRNTTGFDPRSHRCDRAHAKLHGLDVWSEEIRKPKPTRSSHEYGKRLVKPLEESSTTSRYVYLENYLDPSDRKYARIAKVKSDFYNRNGINDLSASLGNL